MTLRPTRFQAVMAAFALTVTAPTALAFIQPDTGSTPGSSPKTMQVSQQAVELSPIVVSGQHMPFPVALQMIKKALSRPWSSARADRDKMVCRFEEMMGSHLQTLRCKTNAQYFRETEQTRMGMFLATSGAYGGGPTAMDISRQIETGAIPIMAEVADWADSTPVNPGALKVLLAKLPPADSSYTLEVTDHGKPVAAYVIKNGELVKVYVVKKNPAGGGT